MVKCLPCLFWVKHGRKQTPFGGKATQSWDDVVVVVCCCCCLFYVTCFGAIKPWNCKLLGTNLNPPPHLKVYNSPCFFLLGGGGVKKRGQQQSSTSTIFFSFRSTCWHGFIVRTIQELRESPAPQSLCLSHQSPVPDWDQGPRSPWKRLEISDFRGFSPIEKRRCSIY